MDRFSLLPLAVLLFACGGPATEPPDPASYELEPRVSEHLALATEAVRADPRSGAAWGRLGEIYAIHGLSEPAMLCYGEASAAAPDDWRWPYLDGLVRREADPAAALERFERAVEL